jgi:hypothetical protein
MFGSATATTASTFVASGLIGGLTSLATGGHFASGFLAAAVGSLAGPLTGGNPGEITPQGVLVSALLGGAASVLGGGKFANGAVTGAFAYAAASWGQEAANDNDVGTNDNAPASNTSSSNQPTASSSSSYDPLPAMDKGDIETVVVTGQSVSLNTGNYIQIAANIGAANDNYARQRACTTAGYQCVQEGYPARACYMTEQNCNMLSYIYKNYPEATPSHSVTIVFPNGSTVIIPEGFDPVPGVKVTPPGKPRRP